MGFSKRVYEGAIGEPNDLPIGESQRSAQCTSFVMFYFSSSTMGAEKGRSQKFTRSPLACHFGHRIQSGVTMSAGLQLNAIELSGQRSRVRPGGRGVRFGAGKG